MDNSGKRAFKFKIINILFICLIVFYSKIYVEIIFFSVLSKTISISISFRLGTQFCPKYECTCSTEMQISQGVHE